MSTSTVFANDSSQSAALARSLVREMARQRKTEAERIGQRIVQLRQKARLTQPKVAERSKVSLRAYQKWEAGEATPRWHNYEALAKVFKVKVEDILGPDTQAADDGHQMSDDLKRFEARLDEVMKGVDELRELLASERAAAVASQDDPGPVVLGDQDAPPTPGTPRQDETDEGEADEPDAG